MAMFESMRGYLSDPESLKALMTSCATAEVTGDAAKALAGILHEDIGDAASFRACRDMSGKDQLIIECAALVCSGLFAIGFHLHRYFMDLDEIIVSLLRADRQGTSMLGKDNYQYIELAAF
jgi:hypothetical protein